MLKKSILTGICFFFMFAALNAEVTLLGQKGLVRTISAKTLEQGKLVVNLSGEYSGAPAYIISPTNPTVAVISTNLGLSFGVTNYLDLSFGLPIYLDILDGDKTLVNFPNKVEDGGPGDVAIGLKLQYPPYPHSHVFDMAYMGFLTLPTGAKSKGIFPRQAYYIPKDYNDQTGTNASFYTAESPAIDMKMLWTVDFGSIAWESQEQTQIQLHINYGARFNTNSDLEHAFLLNTALEYNPIPFLTIFSEFGGETRLSKFTKGFHIGDDPLRVTPGVSINTPVGMKIKISADKSLCRDTVLVWHQRNRIYSTKIIPDWSVNGAIQWTGFLIPKDKDHDGIKDNEDKCPNEPEDLDGFEDSDGCPELDNDKDGIPDLKDRCPNEAEDMDGFEDSDGCPDLDNDKDGIPDLRDRCSNEPEDMDGFEDTDGCPDLDNDRDGIPDSQDRCPNEPEDKDGFEDTDGCPDIDNDRDGIPDTRDKCPNEAENINGFQDEDGCPDAVKQTPKAKKIEKQVVLRGVNFKSGSAELTYESFAALDVIAEQLNEYPDVRIEIRGYTDNVGKRAENIRLSQMRAESIKTYLVQKGIAMSRIIAMGYGPDNPVASNRTAAGRAENRRTEMYRLN